MRTASPGLPDLLGTRNCRASTLPTVSQESMGSCAGRFGNLAQSSPSRVPTVRAGREARSWFLAGRRPKYGTSTPRFGLTDLMTHLAAPPAVVMAIATAVAPLRRRSRAQMKARDLLCTSAARDRCRGAIKAFRVWQLCQPLLEFIEFEQWLTKRLQRQPYRAIL